MIEANTYKNMVCLDQNISQHICLSKVLRVEYVRYYVID